MNGKRAYVMIAEAALGHDLPPGAIVHHVDGDRRNSRNDNLCVLQDQAEHLRVHRRLRILRAGGNPWTQQICCSCQQVKDVEHFAPSRRQSSGECIPCVVKRHYPNPETPEQRSERGRRGAEVRWAKKRRVSLAEI